MDRDSNKKEKKPKRARDQGRKYPSGAEKAKKKKGAARLISELPKLSTFLSSREEQHITNKSSVDFSIGPETGTSSSIDLSIETKINNSCSVKSSIELEIKLLIAVLLNPRSNDKSVIAFLVLFTSLLPVILKN